MSSDQKKNASSREAAIPTRTPRCFGFVAEIVPVVALLAAHFTLAVTSVMDKCTTFDEIAHLTGGSSYWLIDDYRINPENGNFPQRWAALGLFGGQYKFPSTNTPAWKISSSWHVGHQFFYKEGNDLSSMLLRARTMIVLLSVAAALLTYIWSRQLFGVAGGMISLVLYAFNPSMLANGSLVTSDMAAAAFFLAASFALWKLLQRVTIRRLLLSCLATAGLMVAKMSGVFFVPMALLLAAAVILRRDAMVVALGKTREIAGRAHRTLLIAGLAVAHVIVAVFVIWMFYDFRFSAMKDSTPGVDCLQIPWEEVLSGGGPVNEFLRFARDEHLLPEGYLYGFAHVHYMGQARNAFLNGQYSPDGWWYFFPYCWLYKTPLSLMAMLLLAVAAATAKGFASPSFAKAFREALYNTWPLWMLMGVYWATALTSKLNIGHRHILPTYPVYFILSGAAAYWLARRAKVISFAMAGILLFCVAEAAWTWPNYLAYFNQIAGGPKNGYKHLVDSSLDWGQDLPGLKKWLDREGLPNSTTPVYLSYFGTGSPTYYGITNVRRLPGFFDLDRRKKLYGLTPGVYCFSATTFEPVLNGPWNPQKEQVLKSMLRIIDPFADDGRMSMEKLRFMNMSMEQWDKAAETFDLLRMDRLCAYLRHTREPDDMINYSILIYRLSDDDLRKGILGPPAEMVPVEKR
jgi:4-amino-4-deoxy-L-arabinose transferase-like glycosyltransferase